MSGPRARRCRAGRGRSGFDLAGGCGLALETADGETLLGDGRQRVPRAARGRTGRRHDQDQQQRRGEYQLGRDRAALVTSQGATPPTPSRARWRAQPPQGHRVGQFPVLMLFAVVSTLEAMTATAPIARPQQSGDDDRLGRVAASGRLLAPASGVQDLEQVAQDGQFREHGRSPSFFLVVLDLSKVLAEPPDAEMGC